MAPSAEHLEQLSNVVRAKAFLGREFLTWLWYCAETRDGSLKVSAKGRQDDLEIDFWIGDRMSLESSSGLTLDHTIKGGDPSQCREARLALASGKSVRELKLVMAVHGYGEFSTMLSSDELNPRSLKLPQLEDGSEAAKGDTMPILVRLKQTEAFLGALDGLFAKFLAVRTGDDWEDGELKRMRDWIRTRAEAELLH